MADFSFLHAADLHLDTPFEGIRADAPEIQQLLVEASLRSWDALVSLAIERSVAFVLLAGDLYDGAERGIRAQFRIKTGLDRLSAAGIHTCIVHGNHDPLEGWHSAAQFAPEVTVFGAKDVGRVVIERDGERLATIYGTSFGARVVEENLALRYRRGDGEGIHIGLLHCTVGSNTEHAQYSPCTLDHLRESGMDYWALGHIHKRQILSERPWVVYPGNIQGRSAKPSEQGEKGVLLIQVRDGHIEEPQFVPLDCARFVEHVVDIAALSDTVALHSAAGEGLDELRATHGDRGLIVRVVLRGRSTLHRELARPGALDELTIALRHEMAVQRPALWVESIHDETEAPIDRDVIMARGDFTAELLRRIDSLETDPEALRALCDEDLHATLRRRLELFGIEVDDSHILEALRRAEVLALDLLEAEAIT